jgi:thiol:disulfide interchange protein
MAARGGLYLQLVRKSSSLIGRFLTVSVGAFVLGMVSALIAAPCTGPMLGALLTWISRTRDVCATWSMPCSSATS